MPLDFALDRTLVFETPSPVTPNQFTLRFTWGIFNGLLLQATVESSLYKVYYPSYKSMLCIEGEGKGIVHYNVWPGNTMML